MATVATADRRQVAERSEIGAAVRTGAIWGVIAAAVMAMFAMVAGATYLGTGFFTPMYHIASSVIAPDPMMTSVQNATEGQSVFYFAAGPAVVGMTIHLVTGMGFGILFALLARALRLSGAMALIAGILFGIGVMLFNSFISLPTVASMFGGGEAIAEMPTLVGWPTFTIEHAMYGAVLGAGWLLFSRSAAGDRRGAHDR